MQIFLPICLSAFHMHNLGRLCHLRCLHVNQESTWKHEHTRRDIQFHINKGVIQGLGYYRHSGRSTMSKGQGMPALKQVNS